MTVVYLWQMLWVINGEYGESTFFTSPTPFNEIQTIEDVRMRASMTAPMDFELDVLTIFSVYRVIDGRLVDAELVYRTSSRSLEDTEALATEEIDVCSICEYFSV